MASNESSSPQTQAVTTANVRQVKIVDLTGKTRTLTLQTECTVDELFQELINKGLALPGTSVDQVRLIFEGTELVKGEKKFLHDYDIPQMGATLYTVIGLKGGAHIRQVG